VAALESALCSNCGAPAPGRYCGQCGQRQDKKLASVRSMAVEAIQDQLSLGAELPRTLAALLFRPGFLTREYLAGRIVRYVPPLRLYLVSSLAFFFILSWTTDIEKSIAEGEQGMAAAAKDSSAVKATTGPGAIKVDAPGAKVDMSDMDLDIELDTLGTAVWTPAARWVQRRVNGIKGMDRVEFERRFLSGLQRNAPRAVFLLLPIYAFILKLLYVRRKRLYAEHFVFALHVHAFVFVLFSLSFVAPDWLDNLGLAIGIPLYVFLAMLHVYRQSIPKTLLKYGALFMAYCTALLFLLVVTAVVTALTV
jgi:hypothetical protein